MAIVSSSDIIDILFQNEITDIDRLNKFLNNNFSKK